MNSVADNLCAHLPGLVPSDADSQHEKRVYEQLAARHREAAAMLQAIGTEMAEQRDMPMGEHDVHAVSPTDVTDALEGMVRAEAQLVALVQQQLTQHQAILDGMRS
jgi:hypothetical protein